MTLKYQGLGYMSTKDLFVKGHQGIGMHRNMGALAENLKKFRAKKKISQVGLAKAIGASQNTIAAIESGITKRTKLLPEIARELGVSIEDLDPSIGPSENNIVPGGSLVGDNDLKVYASVEAGDGNVVVSSDPVQTVRRPDPLATVKDGYGVIVVGDSMSPLVRPGSTVLVHPHLPPKVEDICLFMTSDDAHDFRATIKEYVGQTKDLWKVRRYGPDPKDFTLKKSEWPRCHVVVGQYNRR